MAKKSSPAKKQPTAKAMTQPKRATKRAPVKKPVKKKATTPAAKASLAKKSAPKPAATRKPPTKSTIKLATVKMPKKSLAAQPADGYLATLNDWRQTAVATVRRIAGCKRSQQPAAKTAARKASAKVAAEAVSEPHGPLAWIKSHAKPASGLWHRMPGPRKLFKDTGAKLRHVNLASLTSAGKKELQELVHLAGKLSEISALPSRPAKGRAKRK